MEAEEFVSKLVEKMEQEFNARKDQECEELYHAILEVLQERKATIQNVLYVLDLMRDDIAQEERERVFGSKDTSGASVTDAEQRKMKRRMQKAEVTTE